MEICTLQWVTNGCFSAKSWVFVDENRSKRPNNAPSEHGRFIMGMAHVCGFS